MSISKLYSDDKQWFFRNPSDSRGVYYTDRNGEGIFYQSDRTGQTKQIIGTCQFSACATASGTRKKLNKLFDSPWEDPRI